MLGQERLAKTAALVEAVIVQAGDALELDVEQGTVDARVTLEDGRLLGGTISGVRGDVLGHVGFARIGSRQRLGAWTQLLLLTAAFPERTFETVSVGRAHAAASKWLSVSVSSLAPPSWLKDAGERERWAREELARLIDLYDRGLVEPLPLYCQTSAELASAPQHEARGRAESVWKSDWDFPREDKDEEHLLVLGGQRSLEELLAERPREGEDWFDGRLASRVECFAHRLWDGLLAVERVIDR
jgi:exodeoxyribonuclease V gamma subunit